MRLSDAPLTPSDVCAVMAAPSPVTLAEIEAAGDTLHDRRRRMLLTLAEGRGLAILHGEAVIAAYIEKLPTQPGEVRRCMFAATAHYFELGARGVSFTRKALDRFTPAARVRAVTLAHGSQLARWFLALGFRETESTPGRGRAFIREPAHV